MISFKEVWGKMEKHPGYFFFNEAKAFYGTLLHVPKNGVVVELGSLFGKSAIVIGEVSNEIGFKFWCVDAFVTDGEPAEKSFRKHVLDVYPKANLIKGTTDEVAKSWTKKIDFLFIDANHQDEGINNDCINWIPFVKKGGYVAFHDYNNDLFPHVKTRVEEHTQGWDVIAIDQDSIVIKRKP